MSIPSDQKSIKPSHTPGPWRVKRNSVNWSVKDHREWFIAENVRNLPDGSRDANAHLIAAAPEMLDRLKLIHAGMNCICQFLPFVGKDAPCETCQIKDIISKAEGR